MMKKYTDDAQYYASLLRVKWRMLAWLIFSWQSTETIKTMRPASPNRFDYLRSSHLTDTHMLRAQMSDFSYDKHAHEELSIGLTQRGRQFFSCDGRAQFSSPGQVIVFNPGQVHDGHNQAGNTLEYEMLYIHPQQLQPMLAAAGVAQVDDFRVEKNVISSQPLQLAVMQLTHLIASGNQDALLQDYWLYQLSARLAAFQQQFVANNRLRRVDQLMLRARDFIRDNVQLNLSIEQVSGAVGLSKYHFIRMFRSQFGITPHQYIINCRLHAARVALDKGARLDDVVFDYFFTDLSHFNRRFKPVFGMTPKQYQRALKKSN